ncbi:MAG: biotin--[acetyl-CoA-carboxylase] ligase [Oligoflexia bacterium]|nr:biotin--[acetyl-CoA-carboxylase] ligase [Oligoflexia bacterium]
MSHSMRIQAWEDLIRQHCALIEPIVCLEQVGSTMDAARELRPASQVGCALALARQQIAGRGRQGRVWEQSGVGLYATYVLGAKTTASALVGFSLVVGCALRRVLSAYGAQVCLKWPNDILSLDGRKLSGVLVELVGNADYQRLLVGIGVNLNLAPAQVTSLGQVAVALGDIGARVPSIPELAADIGAELVGVWGIFLRSGFAAFRDEWISAAYGLGREVMLDAGQEKVCGLHRGVDAQGCLQLEVAGNISTFCAGHVSMIR